MYQNSRLPEAKQVLSIYHSAFIDNLSTVSYSYQLVNGGNTAPESIFPDESQARNLAVKNIFSPPKNELVESNVTLKGKSKCLKSRLWT